MARTAPVPNIPAIPGMNPGVFVMGGGGAGGGGSGAGGNGNKKNQGAGGENGGNDAAGDGKGAGNCGQGGAGGCTNCSSGTSAGDPVDVVSGEVFTLPNMDLGLGGPIALYLNRVYCMSSKDRDTGLGFGWTHSLGWELTVERRHIVVRNPYGPVVRFEKVQTEEAVLGSAGGWILSRRSDGSYRLDTNDDYLHVFEPVDPDRTRYRFASVQHRTGNRIALQYSDTGLLSAIIDSAGRTIRVQRDSSKHISALSVTDPSGGRTIVYARYAYSDAGDLVTYTGADGEVSRYAYDPQHRLVRLTYPSGLTFHYRYDEQNRCCETWGEHPSGKDPALDDSVADVLADGSPAKGIYHTKFEWGADGYSEVVDSVRLLRFFADPKTGLIAKGVGADGGVSTRTFDQAGNVSSHTDPMGATTTYEWDWRGRLMRETDALGRSFVIVRDEQGRVIQNIDQGGGVIECHRDSRGNAEIIVDQRGAVTSYKFDERSLVTEITDPNGAKTVYESDAHGNLVKIVQPNGATWGWTWDYFGRPLTRTNPKGGVTRYTFSDGGSLMRIEEPGGRVLEYEHDPMGSISAIRDEFGSRCFRWGGLRWPLGGVARNGDEVRYTYNREGWNVRAYNERGEVAEFLYDQCGYVCEERSYDGTITRVGYDKLGRRISWWTDHGLIEIERDIIGRIQSVSYPDDTTETYKHNDFDDLVEAKGPGGTFSFDRDQVGHIVKETQEVAGKAFSVQVDYDVMGYHTRVRSSLGEEERIERDAMGNRVSVALDGQNTVRYYRDILGFIVRRALPGGAEIVSDYDERCRLTRRRVMVPKPSGPKVGQAEPQWMGAVADGTVIHKAYWFASNDNVIAAWDKDKGTTKYTYDLRSRLLSRVPESGQPEYFQVDPTSNIYEAGAGAPQRVYGQGNRLLRRGRTEYKWDKAGFMTEKRRVGGERDQVWTYHWNGQGHLAAVDLPSGGRVEFRYDPFGRRMLKRVLSRDADGSLVLKSTTRFVWMGSAMIHEIRTDAASSETLERVYRYDDMAMRPWAHQDLRRSEKGLERSEWFYYVGDVIDAPEYLVTGDGRIACRMERTAYGTTTVLAGALTTTPMRFEGQYEDEETGLVYNYYRYYDPESGRYISADPWGLDSGENVFSYCRNPIGLVDPLGLEHKCTVSVETENGDVFVPAPHPDDRTGSGRRDSNGVCIPGCRSGYRNQEQGGKEGKAKPTENADFIPGAVCVKGDGKSVSAPGERTTRTTQETAHTEQGAIEWAKKNLDGKLKNSKMRLGGEKPPCPRCHTAMRKFAEEQGACVEYNYPTNQKMIYDGRAKADPRGVSASGDNAKALLDGYKKAEASPQANAHGADVWQKPYEDADKGTPKMSADHTADSFNEDLARPAGMRGRGSAVSKGGPSTPEPNKK